jgi:hypothetical protein
MNSSNKCPASYTTFYLTDASTMVVKHLRTGNTEILKNGGDHSLPDLENLFNSADRVPIAEAARPPIISSFKYDTMEDIIASNRKSFEQGLVTSSKCMLVEVIRLVGDVRQKGYKVEASDYSSCAPDRVRYNPPYRFKIVFWDQASHDMLRLWERNDQDSGLLLHIPSVTVKRYRDEFEATVKALGNEEIHVVDRRDPIAREFRRRKGRLQDGILVLDHHVDESDDEVEEPKNLPTPKRRKTFGTVEPSSQGSTPRSSPISKIPKFIFNDHDSKPSLSQETQTVEIGSDVRCYYRGGSFDIPFCTLENLDKQKIAYTVGQVTMVSPPISQLWKSGEEVYFRLTLCCGKTVKFIHFKGEAALVFLDSTRELNVALARKKLENLIDRWIDLCVIRKTINGHSELHGFGTKIRG